MAFEKLFGVGFPSEKLREEVEGEKRRKRVNKRPAKSRGAGQREQARERKLKRREGG